MVCISIHAPPKNEERANGGIKKIKKRERNNEMGRWKKRTKQK
jgi:hypothetical protein